MKFIPGKLYKTKLRCNLYISYDLSETYIIESGTILLYLDYFKHTGYITVNVKRFLVDNKIVMDSSSTYEHPEKYFEHVALLNT